MSGNRRGIVRFLAGAEEVDAYLKRLPAQFLWHADYPDLTVLRASPIDPFPESGRAMCATFEIRFFERGTRGLVLSEEAEGAPQPDDQCFAAEGPHPVVVSDKAARVGMESWRVSTYFYRHRLTGHVAWTRWSAEPLPSTNAE
jgi:hypothetical protein